MFTLNGRERPDDASSSGVATPAAAASSSMEEEHPACPKCGCNVPAANLILHEARCNGSRPAQEQSQQQQQQQQQPESESESLLQPNEREPLQQQQTLERLRSRAAVSSNSDSGSSSTSGAPASAPWSAAEWASAYSNASAPPVETATFAGNIQPPRTTTSQSPATTQPSQPSGANLDNTGENNVQLAGGQWQCPRCTLINESRDTRCNACLAPQSGNNPNHRPPGTSTNERLLPEEVENNEWVNVTYSPQFQRDRNGIRRVPTTNNNTNNNNNNRFNIHVQNPLVHSTSRVGTAARMFNGIVNGAIIGSVFAGMGGMIVGGIAGAAGGAIVDRSRSREEQQQINETREVADMLARDEGGIEAGSIRVHRGGGHITALASDSNGRNRVIRVRYGDGLEAARRLQLQQQQRRQQQQQQQSNNTTTAGTTGESQQQQQQQQQRVEGARESLEQSLLEILVHMSYSRDFGPGPGNNVILQPEESFEELIRRFGLGNDNRGASQAVIDSYPVEVVSRREGGVKNKEDGERRRSQMQGSEVVEDKRPESDDEKPSHESMETDDSDDLGTCGICLEDYKEGECKKALACPNHPHCFHKECIDKWLKLVSSCPICKNDVGMYKKQSSS